MGWNWGNARGLLWVDLGSPGAQRFCTWGLVTSGVLRAPHEMTRYFQVMHSEHQSPAQAGPLALCLGGGREMGPLLLSQAPE